MTKRDISKVGQKKSFYSERNSSGQFVSISNIGKSIKEDSNIKAKKKVKPGHGHEGDLIK